MPTRNAWANGFVRQARSDWGVYRLLAASSVPPCHALHYLQMACEKVAKAYRCRDTPANVDELQQHHVGFTRFMRAFLLSPAIARDYEGQAARLREIAKAANQLAKEIERLAPAVDREARPDNAEYPWPQGDHVIVPCDYSFPGLSLLAVSRGRAFLRLISRALDDFEKVHIQ